MLIAVAVAAAAAPHGPAYGPAHIHQTASLTCLNGWIPLHSGYAEDIHAIAARGDGPGPLTRGTGEYVAYIASTSWAGPDPSARYNPMSKNVPRSMDGETAAMATVTVVNWLAAPPGPCVWEHEYIAGEEGWST